MPMNKKKNLKTCKEQLKRLTKEFKAMLYSRLKR